MNRSDQIGLVDELHLLVRLSKLPVSLVSQRHDDNERFIERYVQECISISKVLTFRYNERCPILGDGGLSARLPGHHLRLRRVQKSVLIHRLWSLAFAEAVGLPKFCSLKDYTCDNLVVSHENVTFSNWASLYIILGGDSCYLLL